MDTQNRSEQDRSPVAVPTGLVNIGLIAALSGFTTWSFGVESLVVSVFAVGAVVAIVALAAEREQRLGRRHARRRSPSRWVLLIAPVVLLIAGSATSILVDAVGRPEYAPALGVIVFVLVMVVLLIDERAAVADTENS